LNKRWKENLCLVMFSIEMKRQMR